MIRWYIPVGAAAKTILPESQRQQGIRMPELGEVAKIAETPKKAESPEKCEEPIVDPLEVAAAVDIVSSGEIEGVLEIDLSLLAMTRRLMWETTILAGIR